MIGIDDVKVIVYDKNKSRNPLVRKFLSLTGREYMPYSDDSNLNGIIKELIKKGFRSKEVIILKEFFGRVFQKCPGSKEVICCNYLLLNICFDCFYNCTYCFLNSYLNTFGIIQFTNFKEQLGEFRNFIEKEEGVLKRIGTGEFTDSLMMDEITGFAEYLINITSEFKHVMIEFKTKSSNVEHLLNVQKKGNAVLAWSLNTEKNIMLYEEGTASLHERIDSAVKAADAGYFVAFHFDPVIVSENFIEEYFNIIDTLFSRVNNEKIVWISLGCFRYSPGFKEILNDRFPEEKLTAGELFPDIDGKYRYLKDVRIDIYRQLKEKIDSYRSKAFIYLCMESPQVWKEVFNIDLKKSDHLELLMSDHLYENFISVKPEFIY